MQLCKIHVILRVQQYVNSCWLTGLVDLFCNMSKLNNLKGVLDHLSLN